MYLNRNTISEQDATEIFYPGLSLKLHNCDFHVSGRICLKNIYNMIQINFWSVALWGA